MRLLKISGYRQIDTIITIIIAITIVSIVDALYSRGLFDGLWMLLLISSFHIQPSRHRSQAQQRQQQQQHTHEVWVKDNSGAEALCFLLDGLYSTKCAHVSFFPLPTYPLSFSQKLGRGFPLGRSLTTG